MTRTDQHVAWRGDTIPDNPAHLVGKLLGQTSTSVRVDCLMAEVRSQHRLGIALVVAAAIAWSTAPFFTRLLPYDSWTILFWRGLFAGGMIMVLMVLLQGRAGLRDLIRMRKSGWLVASLSAAAMIAFIPSLQLTGVANVAIIIATGPFVTAALAWVWLREVPSREP